MRNFNRMFLNIPGIPAFCDSAGIVLEKLVPEDTLISEHINYCVISLPLTLCYNICDEAGGGGGGRSNNDKRGIDLKICLVLI